ncbi:Immunoglobulin G-binding protein A precursor [Teratosphaeria destructans]|uniref:Immunoglobulin G-binding protein A n=1 Tax=Teratosphaeria destructans TaxID=418781 RepID=A0A9W7ST31_9PEZI|nr:Immunoglobulin G-binding protein A precursor [Teratosphaeria destructans]
MAAALELQEDWNSDWGTDPFYGLDSSSTPTSSSTSNICADSVNGPGDQAANPFEGLDLDLTTPNSNSFADYVNEPSEQAADPFEGLGLDTNTLNTDPGLGFDPLIDDPAYCFAEASRNKAADSFDNIVASTSNHHPVNARAGSLADNSAKSADGKKPATDDSNCFAAVGNSDPVNAGVDYLLGYQEGCQDSYNAFAPPGIPLMFTQSACTLAVASSKTKWLLGWDRGWHQVYERSSRIRAGGVYLGAGDMPGIGGVGMLVFGAGNVPGIGGIGMPVVGAGNVPGADRVNVPTGGAGDMPGIGRVDVPVVGAGNVPGIGGGDASVVGTGNMRHIAAGDRDGDGNNGIEGGSFSKPNVHAHASGSIDSQVEGGSISKANAYTSDRSPTTVPSSPSPAQIPAGLSICRSRSRTIDRKLAKAYSRETRQRI